MGVRKVRDGLRGLRVRGDVSGNDNGSGNGKVAGMAALLAVRTMFAGGLLVEIAPMGKDGMGGGGSG